MKSYQYKFTKLIIALLWTLLVLGLAGFILTIWRFVDNGGFTDFYKNIQFILMWVISLALCIVAVSMIISSVYVINDTDLIVRFGVIYSRYKISKITDIRYFKKKKQLVVYFGEEYTVIVVNEKWYEDFIKTLMEKNKKITYDEIEEDEKMLK